MLCNHPLISGFNKEIEFGLWKISSNIEDDCIAWNEEKYLNSFNRLAITVIRSKQQAHLKVGGHVNFNLIGVKIEIKIALGTGSSKNLRSIFQ